MQLDKRTREAVRVKYLGRCAYCGEPLSERWHVDHLDPVSRELKYERGKGFVQTGKFTKPENHRLENFMPACVPCNLDKHAMMVEDWRKKLEDSINVLNRNSSTYRHAIRFGLLQRVNSEVLFFFEQERGYRD